MWSARAWHYFSIAKNSFEKYQFYFIQRNLSEYLIVSLYNCMTFIGEQEKITDTVYRSGSLDSMTFIRGQEKIMGTVQGAEDGA